MLLWMIGVEVVVMLTVPAVLGWLLKREWGVR